MNELRILRVADVPDNRTGGMSRTMYCTGDALARAGHRVDYVFSDGLPSRVSRPLRRFAVPPKLPWLVRRLGAADPFDVVEVHEPLAAAYCMMRRAGARLPPLVVFSYGLEERGRQAELAYKRAKGIPVSLKNRFSPLTVVWQAMYAVRHADHVICSNATDAAHLIKAGVPADRVTVHFSGVEEPFLEAGRQLAGADRPPDILFLGTWILRKGVAEIAIAITEVLRANPLVRFTAAGCGVPESAVLADFPAELHSRITVQPRIDGTRQLTDVYARHSIFVLPSYYEGHPLAMVEAAAMRMAIVTTATCGMLDFVQDGSNGLLIPVGDSAGLGSAVQRLIADAGLRRSLGDAAFATAERHTWTAAADGILRAYQSAIAGARQNADAREDRRPRSEESPQATSRS